LPPDFRRFAPSTRAIDVGWSSGASSNDTWKATGVAWSTNNGPLQVVNAAGTVGVQKPGVDGVTNPLTAATEKIVADLAHLLQLPVPPVTLWDRGAGISPRYVSVSAWAFETTLTWQQAEPLLSPDQKAALIPSASAIAPFECWIEASDRQNGGNALVSVEGNGDVLGAWIDYAFALDFAWKGNHMPTCQLIPPLYPPVGAAAAEVMKEVADKIASVENAAIEGIVNRIPSEYLPRPIADNIIRNLLSRRASVRALL
jgi:hypothetical protein